MSSGGKEKFSVDETGELSVFFEGKTTLFGGFLGDYYGQEKKGRRNGERLHG